MPFITAASRRIEYERIGVAGASRPTLVFLHEGLGSIAMWRDFPARVAHAVHCDAVVYSRYGYGNSDPLAEPRDARYMHDEALIALPEILDQLSIDRPILIGHSDGGSIALIHAGAGARPVTAIATLAAHVLVEDISVASIAQTKTSFETADLRARIARHHADVDSAFWGWNRIWLAQEFRRWNIEEYLPRITCPVLLLSGESDPFARIELLRAAVPLLPRAELVTYPRLGHGLKPVLDDILVRVAAFLGAIER